MHYKCLALFYTHTHTMVIINTSKCYTYTKLYKHHLFVILWISKTEKYLPYPRVSTQWNSFSSLKLMYIGTKKAPSVKGRSKISLTTYYIILSYAFLLTVECRQHLLKTASLNFFQHLQLGSDIQIFYTRTRLSPPLTRFAFPKYPTVFVKVFSYTVP